jgi:hypothetical protein
MKEMTHQEALFFMLKAATVYYKLTADFTDSNGENFNPTKEEVRLAALYQNYIDEMVAIGGDFDL